MNLVIVKESDVKDAVNYGLILAKSIGFSKTKQSMIATAISELARNIIAYAKEGEMEITQIKEGIQVIAKDNGPGIANLELALTDYESTGGSLGIGLPGTKRLMDEFKIESKIGYGTIVMIKKWL